MKYFYHYYKLVMIKKIIILLFITITDCYLRKNPKCNNLPKLQYNYNDIKKPLLRNNYIHYMENKVILLKIQK